MGAHISSDDTYIVSGTVKFFNFRQGYGFILPSDGTSNVFLHVSVLVISGFRDIASGATIKCVAQPGRKGPVARRVLALDWSTTQENPVPVDYDDKFKTLDKVTGRLSRKTSKGAIFLRPDNKKLDDIVVPASVLRDAECPHEEDAHVDVRYRISVRGAAAFVLYPVHK